MCFRGFAKFSKFSGISYIKGLFIARSCFFNVTNILCFCLMHYYIVNMVLTMAGFKCYSLVPLILLTDTGIYILMLEILLKRFFKVIILAALLVIMFALTFHLTFNDFDSRYRVSPFATPLNSIWKTMTMLTGEMDYEGIFRQSSDGSEEQISALPFPEIAYVLWIIFLIIMPILLSNLLVCIYFSKLAIQ